MDLQDGFNFDDLKPQPFKFKYGGQTYVLHEAPEGVGMAYRNAMVQHIKFGEDGKPAGMSGGAEQAAKLLSGCIKLVTETGEQAVSPQTILQWPTRVVKPLFAKAKEISDLEERMDRIALHKQIQENLKKLRQMDQEEELLKNGLPGIGVNSGTVNNTGSSSTN